MHFQSGTDWSMYISMGPYWRKTMRLFTLEGINMGKQCAAQLGVPGGLGSDRIMWPKPPPWIGAACPSLKMYWRFLKFATNTLLLLCAMSLSRASIKYPHTLGDSFWISPWATQTQQQQGTLYHLPSTPPP
jgi:hypothetical protein